MEIKHLHIVALDIPYPPDYGGAIDMFYKIKALYQQGIRITLHCYQYGNRMVQKELLSFCEAVYYYPRSASLLSLPLSKPYIVESRRSKQLLERLLEEDTPILFEGLHTCYWLDHARLRNRLKLVRMHNIEWEYYQHLAQNEKKLFKKTYFHIEAWQLKRFEQQLKYADQILAISSKDQLYLQNRFSPKKVHYLPAFHAYDKVDILLGKGNYALYHGNLAVSENHKAALFLVKEVFAHLPFKLIIAGRNPQNELRTAIQQFNHIELIDNPSDTALATLLSEAHINVLPTFQDTGIKLKLLHALFKGRFCLVNPPMVAQTGLEAACVIAQNTVGFQEQIPILFNQTFLPKDLTLRQHILTKTFSNQNNAIKLVSLINSL